MLLFTNRLHSSLKIKCLVSLVVVKGKVEIKSLEKEESFHPAFSNRLPLGKIAGQLGIESSRPGPILSLILACWGMCFIQKVCSTKLERREIMCCFFHSILYPTPEGSASTLKSPALYRRSRR